MTTSPTTQGLVSLVGSDVCIASTISSSCSHSVVFVPIVRSLCCDGLRSMLIGEMDGDVCNSVLCSTGGGDSLFSLFSGSSLGSGGCGLVN